THVLVHFVPFGCICDHSVALQNSGQNISNWCKSSCHEDALEFFATNAPDPPHWTLNSCFVAFRTIWVHLGPFGCLTKLGAKRAELVQYFMPRSRIEIFRNESTRSAPLDRKLMFCCISYRLGAFATIRLPYKTRGKTFRTGAKVRATKTRWSFSRQTHPIHPIKP